MSRVDDMVATVAGMRDILHVQTRQLDHCLDLLKRHRAGTAALPHGDDDVLSVVSTMMHIAGISGHSVLRLTEEENLGVKDAYPVARAIVESSVNMAFIMAGGSEVASRARRHAEVKMFQGRSREWAAGGIQLNSEYRGELPPAARARLEAMTSEFTTAKGREKPWTPESLRERLDAIGSAFPENAMISLSVSAFNIYRDASEVVHGTYFGALHFWGLTTLGNAPPRTTDDLRMTLLDHQFSILVSVIFAYAGLVECFSRYVGLPALRELAESEIQRLYKLPAIAETLADPDPAPLG